MEIEKYLEFEPFSLNRKEKDEMFTNLMNNLTYYHYKSCNEYKKFLNFFNYKKKKNKINQIPFIPTSLFKKFSLASVPKNQIFKTLKSSGTSGLPSKIFLDKKNANNQRKVLTKIMASILGQERLPMLIVDKNPSKQNKDSFNARSAAIYGFSIFGKDHTYLLNNNGKIDYKTLNIFLEKNYSKKFFIFGFTSLIYEFLIKELSKKSLEFTFDNAILLHGGGWKKMEKIKVSNKIFKQKLLEKLKIKKIHNYYGLVEQTGSIFIDCEKCGYFISSIYSDVIIRDKFFNEIENGKKGIIQLLSLLPTSYPGHNILTEDIGEIASENNCSCSGKGKRFKVYGRNKDSEIRGCSDT